MTSSFSHETSSYTNAAGTLDYMLYRANGSQQRPPLFVMLHGGSQSASDFSVGTRMNQVADECGGMVLYPEQSKAANMMGCWNWHEARHQSADQGEPSMIAGATRQVAEQYGADPSRIYVAGMSAGGAMAAIVGQEYPDLYAAIGVHSGVPTGVASDLFSGYSAMSRGSVAHVRQTRPDHVEMSRPVATIVFHGDRDSTVHPSNGTAIHEQSTRLSDGVRPMRRERSSSAMREAGGRRVTRSVRTLGDGRPHAELWVVHGAGHAWVGGDAQGSFTESDGPDASREMSRFFLQHQLSASARKKA